MTRRKRSFLKKAQFYFAAWLAELGFFHYEGLRGRHPAWWPMARVKYPDGAHSVRMPIGNAVDYRDIFGGSLVP